MFAGIPVVRSCVISKFLQLRGFANTKLLAQHMCTELKLFSFSAYIQALPVQSKVFVQPSYLLSHGA